MAMRRFLAGLSAFLLFFPQVLPAFALRAPQLEHESQLAGLEQAFKAPTVSTGLEEIFRDQLAQKMRESDELSLSGLTQWAASLGKNREELLAAMREIGPTLIEPNGKTWHSFFEVVTEEGNPTGRLKAFSAIHRDGDWHRGTAVLFVTPEEKFVLQQRNDGRRDLSVGGHAELGHSTEETALSEAEEETNFIPDSKRLHEFKNPLPESQGLFRKIGQKAYSGPIGYDEQGIYRSRSKELDNREIDTLYLYRLSPQEFDSLQRRYASYETRGLVVDTLENFLTDFVQQTDRYGSGFQQYFSDPRVLSNILTELRQMQGGLEEPDARFHTELTQLKQKRWLFQWQETFRHFEEESTRHAELFEKFGVQLDQQQDGLGQEQYEVVVPKAALLDLGHREMVLRYLVTVVNNAAWFFLKQPRDTRSSQGVIRLAGPWAQDVKEYIKTKTQLIEALTPTMLYGPLSLEAVPELPLPVSNQSRPIQPIQLGSFDPTTDVPVMGIDVGGTNLKFVVLRKGQVVHSGLVREWSKMKKQLASSGVAAFLANQIRQQWISFSPEGGIPSVLGISWPGPVRGSQISGSVSVERVLSHRNPKDPEDLGLIEEIEEGKLQGKLDLLRTELQMLQEGRFMERLRQKLSKRFGEKVSIHPYRDAFAEAFGVAVATPHPVATVTLTLGTGVGGYFIESDGRVPMPGEPFLYEFGRVVVDMDPTKTKDNRSTLIRGTIRQLFDKEVLDLENRGQAKEIGEALAATAQVMRDVLGSQRVTLSGGNAYQELASLAQAVLKQSTSPADPGVEVVLSPVVAATGLNHSVYTPAVGAAWAALAEYQRTTAGLEGMATVTRAVSLVTVRIYDGLVERGLGTAAAGAVRTYLDPTRTTISISVPAEPSAIGTVYHHRTVVIPEALRAMARAVEELPEEPAAAQAMLQQAGPADIVFVDAALVTEGTREAWRAVAQGQRLRVISMSTQTLVSLTASQEFSALIAAAPAGELLEVEQLLAVSAEGRQLFIYL